jgi:hypothetical protein
MPFALRLKCLDNECRQAFAGGRPKRLQAGICERANTVGDGHKFQIKTQSMLMVKSWNTESTPRLRFRFPLSCLPYSTTAENVRQPTMQRAGSACGYFSFSSEAAACLKAGSSWREAS